MIMLSEKIVYCNNMELESQEEYGCVGAIIVKKAHKNVVAMFSCTVLITILVV